MDSPNRDLRSDKGFPTALMMGTALLDFLPCPLREIQRVRASRTELDLLAEH